MTKLTLVLGFLTCFHAGCGGGGGSDSSGSPPDLTGEWVGTFTSNGGGAAETVSLVIVDQNGEDFSGTWDSNALVSEGQVNGYIYPSNKKPWIADLDMTQGDDITCCVPLLGCYTWASRQISMSGYYDNVNGSISIVDEDASSNYGCLIHYGTMTLTRQ